MQTGRHLAGAVVLAVSLVLVFATVAQETPGPTAAELGRLLSRVAKDPPGNSRASISVVDVQTGTEVYALKGDEKLNPASNVKIITAACALKQLGPEFRFSTTLHGRWDGAAIRGPLYIKGHADPTLSTSDLWEMVAQLRALGIRRVESGVVVDDSYFDRETLPYGYDQQKDEDNPFRAPVGAVSLNHNAQAIRILAGPQAMRPAKVVLDPPDYAVLVNDTVTVGEGAHNPKISAQSYEDRTRIRVWGQVPLGARSVTYYRRIDNPSLFTGYGLKGALEQGGIAVGGGVQLGPLPPGTAKLAEHVSDPLSEVLWEAGKISNNFVTETVLKTIGAEEVRTPATWADAISVVTRILGDWGLVEGSYTMRNGSGLFDANRFSARQITTVLRRVYLDSSIRPEFIAQLATGGADGTIRSRFSGKRVRRRVRAKTGTLADVSALSGYVFDREGRRPIAFSILINDAPGFVSACRTYQERIVTAIAEFLNPQ